MALEVLAERIAAFAPSSLPLDALGLRVLDTVAALFSGAATEEGRALARVHSIGAWRLGDRSSGGIDPAAVSAAAGTIRLTEIDDIHLETCITPSAAILPPALALAAAHGTAPAAAARAVTVGYDVLFRYGRLLGGAAALARGIWPTLAAAPLGAAATTAALLRLPAERTAHALRLALLRSVSRVGQTVPPLPGRWYLVGEAVADGLKAAFAAAAGLITDPSLDAGLLPDSAAERLAAPIDPMAALAISAKPFCTSRQAANGVVAFRALVDRHALRPEQIAAIEVEVPGAYLGMLNRPADPANRLSLISSQGMQIAAAILCPDMLDDVARGTAPSPELIAFAAKVKVRAGADLDREYPMRWPSRVTIALAGGDRVAETALEIDGDPGKPLSREFIRNRFQRACPGRSEQDCLALDLRNLLT
ncbi:MAG: MmgE/PrpD family protein [Proteobacteria bacterium]|nr:MmgE/PrpD family protein [Pseudomonadota bacterium]